MVSDVMWIIVLDHLSISGIRSYGMSVTTLEEVFIKVQHQTHTQAVADAGRNQEVVSTHNIQVDAKNIADLESNTTPPPVTFKRIEDGNHMAYLFRHIQAMILKRYYYFLRDTKTWILQFAIPGMCYQFIFECTNLFQLSSCWLACLS